MKIIMMIAVFFALAMFAMASAPIDTAPECCTPVKACAPVANACEAVVSCPDTCTKDCSTCTRITLLPRLLQKSCTMTATETTCVERVTVKERTRVYRPIRRPLRLFGCCR